MYKFWFILVLALANNALLAQIPAYGSPNKLDIACWNIEWFGDVTNGPSNEETQFSNVLKVMRATQVDVWGLGEIANQQTFNRLLDSLKGYDGALANYSQTQKTGIIYDTALFHFLYGKVVITNQDYDFASGRFPYEVALLPKKGNIKDTLILLVLHLKANTGTNTAKQEAWQRRKNASGHIKTYIESKHPNKKVIVLGDFNDDTDVSIHNGNESPFQNFLDDEFNFRFLTKNISAANTGSTVGRSDVIDHQLMSNELFNLYEINSCKLLPLQNFISGYGLNTSDHYPIFASYNYDFYSGVKKVQPILSSIYPNPLKANESLNLNGAKIIKATNNIGVDISPELFYVPAQRVAGIYMLLISQNGASTWIKLNVL